MHDPWMTEIIKDNVFDANQDGLPSLVWQNETGARACEYHARGSRGLACLPSKHPHPLLDFHKCRSAV